MRFGSDGVQRPKATISMSGLQTTVASIYDRSQGFPLRKPPVVEAVDYAILPTKFIGVL